MSTFVTNFIFPQHQKVTKDITQKTAKTVFLDRKSQTNRNVRKFFGKNCSVSRAVPKNL